MLKFIAYSTLLSLLLLAISANAQDLSRLRVKQIPVSDSIVLDSLYIVNGSVRLSFTNGVPIDSSNFTVYPSQSLLIWKVKPQVDSVKVVYRTFPFNFSKPRFKKDISLLETQYDIALNPFAYTPNQSPQSVIDFGTLDYNGSFARGLSFGNGQDVVLNSSFNLQLAGNITEDIQVVAALTDNNIPIQPDGTTQLLQEFDQVYIQIKKDPHVLTMGDYEVIQSTDYFMRFFKRMQGGRYTGAFDFKDYGNLKTETALALAKGKFAKNQLQVTEGNQGPYQLIGENGETFIIIQAGTERVFVNGKLMKRGSNFDYVIDYNLGEIIFTPNVLITRDLRITVQFEYSDQNYFRSLVYLSNDYRLNDKLNFKVNFFSEQDSKNQPVQADLTSEQKQILTDAGNDITLALYSGVREEEFSSNRIMYKLDTIVAGDSIFAYSTNPDSAFYVLSFTYLGNNRGNYIPAQTTVNGRVYKYIYPLNGVPQGTYEPIIVLIAPKREQLLTFTTDYRPTDKDYISGTFALSNDDGNTFSEIDNENNKGYAGRIGYDRKFSKGKIDTNSTLINIKFNYEFVNRNFDPLERYRPVEFNRDWNYNQLNQQTNLPGDRRIDDNQDQQLGEVGFEIKNRKYGSIAYGFSTFHIKNNYEGYKQYINTLLNRKGYFLNFNMRYLSAESVIDKSKFIRPTVDAYKAFKKIGGWRIGGKYLLEDNKIRDAVTDTLVNSGFVFNDWRVYIAAPDTAKVKTSVTYIRRLDFFPRNNEMRLNNLSNTYLVDGSWEGNPVSQIKWQFTYRQFQNKDSVNLNTNKKFEDFYLGRVEHGLNLFKGVAVSNILYELGSGRDQIRQYAYLPDLSGNGLYIWTDRNDNGIKELNEFDIAPFNGVGTDTLFVRVAVPTNEFEQVNITTYNQTFSLNPKAKLHGKKGVLGFIARFSNITSIQITRRVFRGSDISPFNPFLLNIEDDDLVSINSLLRNSLFFNRSSSSYSLEYTYQANENKNNLASGFESRELNQHSFRVRWNIVKQISAESKYIFGHKISSAQNFADRNYNIKTNEINSKLSYLWKTKFRVSILYNFFTKTNIEINDGELATQHEAKLDARFNVVSKSTITAQVSYALVSYNGQKNTAIEFAMLNGLRNGNNYLWQVTFERTLGNNVQFSLIYDGRKTGESELIHTGRAQIRAVF